MPSNLIIKRIIELKSLEYQCFSMNKISIDRSEIKEDFICSSGPGGQNVNKTSTAVKLCFSVMKSASLTEEQKKRVLAKCASKINSDGEIVVDSRVHREQYLNRKDAWEKLLDMINKALVRPKKRIKTKPTRGSQTRRLDSKTKHSSMKKLRSEKPSHD